MTGVIATIPRFQFSNALGIPLVGGKLYAYLAGTTTPVVTYQDEDLTTENENPITLDSTGSCMIWLDPAKSYKFLLKSILGITQPGWPVDNVSGAATVTSLQPTLDLYAKLTALAAASGGSLVGLTDGRTLQQHLDILSFGVVDIKAPATADEVQAIIDAATGGVIRFHGVFTFDKGLTFRNNLIYEGLGVDISGGGGTQFNFTTTTDAVKIINPLNSSTSANIEISGIWFNSSTLTVDSALLFDTGSSVVAVRRCRFNSSGIGITLDQSELWDIELCSFNCTTSTSTGAWLVNGPDKQIGSNPYFTNRISFRSCDFNGAAGSVGIYDDGGTAHTYENINFNAMGSHIIATGVNVLKIDGGEYEISSAQTIICGLTKRKGGAGAKSPVVSINRTFLYNNVNQPVLAMVAGAVGKLEFTNNVVSTIPGAAVTGLAVGCDQIDAQGNIQIGTVNDDIDLNNVLDVNPAAVGWLAQTTSPTLGNGAIVGSYSRRGKLVTLRQKVTFGSTTTSGSGGYLFPLPFAADPSTFAQLGVVFILIPGIGFYSGVARVTTDGLNVELYTTNNTVVGGAAPAAWVSGSAIEYQITYVAAAPI